MGNTAGKLSEKATRNPLESRRGPPGRRRKTSEIAAGKTPFRVTPHPCGGKACAHISICQRTSLSISIHPHPITHRQSTPVTPLMGLGCVESEPTALAVGTADPLLMGLGCVNPAPTALAAGTAAPLLVGWGCVCMEPKRPVPQNAAGGKSLLVGLPPSTPATAPFGTKRSTQAPCSWGLGA